MQHSGFKALFYTDPTMVTGSDVSQVAIQPASIWQAESTLATEDKIQRPFCSKALKANQTVVKSS